MRNCFAQYSGTSSVFTICNYVLWLSYRVGCSLRRLEPEGQFSFTNPRLTRTKFSHYISLASPNHNQKRQIHVVLTPAQRRLVLCWMVQESVRHEPKQIAAKAVCSITTGARAEVKTGTAVYGAHVGGCAHVWPARARTVA